MDRKVIFIINGYPGAGKDTFADDVVGALSDLGWHARSISSIDPIRNMLRKEGIRVDIKGPAERKLLSDVKAAFNGYDRYADRMASKTAIDFVERPGDRAIFVHVREPDAIAFMADLTPANIWFARVFVERKYDAAALSNISDQNVEEVEYDIRILNHGSRADLEETADVFAEAINEARFEIRSGRMTAGMPRHEAILPRDGISL